MVDYNPVNPRFFLPAVFGNFFTSFRAAFLFRDNLFLLFDGFDLFLKDVDEDALAFDISPNASVLVFGLMNISQSA